MKHWLTHFRVILLSALVLRLGITMLALNHTDRSLLTDSVGYITIANNLQQHSSFSTATEAPYTPDLMRTPLYPGLLYALKITGHEITSMLLLQLFISLATCWLVMKTCVVLTNNHTAAAVAGWFMALDIPSIFFTGFILTETLFTFLLVLCIWYLTRYFFAQKIKYLILSSVFLGFAMLCRPIALLLPFWIGIMCVVFLRKHIPLKHVVYFMLPVLCVCGTWICRNYLVFEELFFTRIGTFNMAWYQASMAKAEAENISVENARWNLFSDAATGMKQLPVIDPVTFYKRLATESQSVLLKHPGIALKNMIKAEVNLLFRPSLGYPAHLLGIANVPKNINTEKIAKSWFSKISTGFQFLHLALLYSGILLLFIFRKTVNNKHLLFFLFLMFVYFLIPGTGPEMEARFRIPLLPIFAILSATGWMCFIAKRTKA